MATQPETPLDLTNEPVTTKVKTKKGIAMDMCSNGSQDMPLPSNVPSASSIDNHTGSSMIDDNNVSRTVQDGANESSNSVDSSPKKARKRKTDLSQVQVDPEEGDSSASPLQRGKYGLRPVPQQVNYYQVRSSVEERKAKTKKEEDQTVKAGSEDGATPPKRRHSSTQSRKGQVKDEKPTVFNVGEIVWATLPTYKTWFPALILSHLYCTQKPPRNGHTWVYWFGDHKVSEIPLTKIKSFIPHFKEFSKGTSSLMSPRMREALQVLSSRAGLTFAVDINTDDDPMGEWAENGFQIPSEKQKPGVNPFAADPMNPIPPLAACYLPLDALQQESLKTDDRLQHIAFYEVESAETVPEQDEPFQIPEFKISQVNRIKNGEIQMNEICIACCCDHNSAADTVNGQKIIHPLFEGLLCKQCRETLKTTAYAPGVDNKNSFCAICGQVGKLAVCDNAKCHRVFCFVCIGLYTSPEFENEIVAADSWDCFVCKPHTLPVSCLLKTRADWREHVMTMYDPLRCFLTSAPLCTPTSPLRVLSLCEGIGTVKVALSKSNLNIAAYYGVESDKEAVSILKHNHQDSIQLVDGVDSLTLEKLITMAPIDLIVGGTRCIDVPSSSHDKKGVFDLKSGGQQFLNFNHILHLVRHFNKGRHVFFLFDSIASLPTTTRDIISEQLMCKPVTVGAKNISSPVRNRYLWSNIPGINRPLPPELLSDYLKLSDAMILRKNSSKSSPSKSDVDADSIDPSELEEMLGFQKGYTDVNSLTKAKRISALSKSWSVPILSHVMWALVDFFESN